MLNIKKASQQKEGEKKKKLKYKNLEEEKTEGSWKKGWNWTMLGMRKKSGKKKGCKQIRAGERNFVVVKSNRKVSNLKTKTKQQQQQAA